jgi:hypothetical protein
MMEKPPTSTQSSEEDVNVATFGDAVGPETASVQSKDAPLSQRRENLILLFITLTQLVQISPLGIGINSGLAIGESLGASRVASTWVVASFPLTQGTFVLIGVYSPLPMKHATFSLYVSLAVLSDFFSFPRWSSWRDIWAQKCFNGRLALVGPVGCPRRICQ